MGQDILTRLKLLIYLPLYDFYFFVFEFRDFNVCVIILIVSVMNDSIVITMPDK